MSYHAQRGEDKRLRELIGDKTDVFYIDVGAWEPDQDSVTKHFYDMGGHGINIEPIPYYLEKLVRARPRDVNLGIAAGDKAHYQEINWIKGTGLTTFVSEHAEMFKTSPQQKLKVWVAPLAAICRKYVPVGQVIDFLKIDVEGYEYEVLLGADFVRWRPNFLCIEATIPATDIPCWEPWKQYVIDQGYLFLNFDGLNMWFQREF